MSDAEYTYTPPKIAGYARRTVPGCDLVTYARREAGADAWTGLRIETTRAGRRTGTTGPHATADAAADAARRSDGLAWSELEPFEALRRRMIEALNYTPAAAAYELAAVTGEEPRP